MKDIKIDVRTDSNREKEGIFPRKSEIYGIPIKINKG
jgi:hypothetical protein